MSKNIQSRTGFDHNMGRKPRASALRLISRNALASGSARLMIHPIASRSLTTPATTLKLFRRNGITVVECLFAMTIMLIGLIGIAAMVPFAGRQASDSYRIVQALAAGENALAVFNSNAVSTPTLNAPWQLIEDAYPDAPPAWGFPPQPPIGDSNASSFESFPKLYEGDRANSRVFSLYKYYYDLLTSFPNTPQGQRTRAAVAQNRALGTGFCVDPMFWGQQLRVPVANTKLMDRDWGNFRRTRFPYYHEIYPASMDPFGSVSGGSSTTPRLFRVTLHDPNTPFATAYKGWMRLPAAIRMATVSGGDVTKISPEKDKASGALRGFLPSQSPGDSIVQSMAPETMQSWIATLTPSETTPVVDPTTLPLGPYDENPATPITPPPNMQFYPESYDLAVVVFSRRNTTELVIDDYPTFASDFASNFADDGITLEGERLCEVLSFGPEHRSSSTFDVELNASAKVSAKIKTGDWVMMSRYVFDTPATTPPTGPIREHHKWYRIIGVSGDEVFPRTVRVAGQPWDWTLPEIAVFQSIPAYTSSASLPDIPPSTTAVTLIPSVINVYQRTVRVSN